MSMLAIAVIPVTAATIDDADALKGVTSGKAVFDVTLGDAGKLALYLSVIEDTHEGLLKQGLKPDLILAFHGPSVLLISKNRNKVPVEQQEKYDEVAELIKELKGPWRKTRSVLDRHEVNEGGQRHHLPGDQSDRQFLHFAHRIPGKGIRLYPDILAGC